MLVAYVADKNAGGAVVVVSTSLALFKMFSVYCVVSTTVVTILLLLLQFLGK